MKLRQFSFLTDENFDPEVVAYLRSLGLNVQTAGETGLLGRADVDHLRAAWASRRVAITHDPDFGSLAISAGESVVGIVFVRPGHISAAFTIASIDAILKSDPDVEPPFLVVARRTGTEVTIRVRRL